MLKYKGKSYDSGIRPYRLVSFPFFFRPKCLKFSYFDVGNNVTLLIPVWQLNTTTVILCWYLVGIKKCKQLIDSDPNLLLWSLQPSFANLDLQIINLVQNFSFCRIQYFYFCFFFLVLVILLVINCWSVKWAVRIQDIFTYAKLLCIVMITIIGFVELGKGLFEAGCFTSCPHWFMWFKVTLEHY